LRDKSPKRKNKNGKTLQNATGEFCKTIATFLFIASFAYAQSDFGSIVGFAKDPSGAVIPKAKIAVQNAGNGGGSIADRVRRRTE
jgi:hypothetical protein